MCSIYSNSPAFDLFSFQKFLNKHNQTIRKIKADKKHGFSYIFGYGNQQKFSKSTQNSCIIYFRIPVQLEQYFENVEIKINIENLC